MRKTNVSRWSAMMIAFVLILSSLAAPVRALGPNSSASLIITGLDPGVEATFYKIIGVNFLPDTTNFGSVRYHTYGCCMSCRKVCF